MLQKIKSYFNREYSKTLPKKERTRKTSVSSAAGRLIIIFFIAMFIFTFVSRAAASFTIARVAVKNPERDKLMYSVSGTGEIKPWEEESLFAEPGYRIDDVYVSVGETVSKDTVLFSYNMEYMQDKYDSITYDIEKINLLVSQEKLRQQLDDGASPKLKLLAIKQAEDNLEAANTKLAEAKADYRDSVLKVEKKEQESKQKDYELRQKEQESRQKKYDTALSNYNSVIFLQEKQLKLSSRVVDDAKEKLLQVNEKKEEASTYIDDYIIAVTSKDEGLIYRAGEALFKAFYGSADLYEEHKEAIFSKALAVRGEGFYLWFLKNNILEYEEELYTLLNDMNNTGSTKDASLDKSQTYQSLKERYSQILQDYFRFLEEYEIQIKLIEDGVDVGSSQLKKLRRDDKRLKEYLEELQTAIEQEADVEVAKSNLYDFMIGDKAEAIEQEVNRATLSLTRAQEDYDLLNKEYEMVRTNLLLELTELKQAIVSTEEETYDFSETLEGKRQAVTAAEEAVRIAKQVMETTKLQHELTENQNSSQGSNATQIAELNLQSYYMDLHKKEIELEEVSTLIELSGEVLSPYDGVVINIGLEAGRYTSGEEVIKIGTGNYVFKGVFSREDNVSIELGGIVDISLAGKKKAIESEIGKISINKEGMIEFISSLPQGEYFLGEKAGFKITTESEQFNQCIPIQALHEDNYGYYVLVIGEREDILGTQLIAERRNVNLLDKGTFIVAVEGILSKNQVITYSNKSIKAGDRVRIE